MPGPLDHLLVVAFAVAWPLQEFRAYPRFLRDAAAGIPGTREKAYAETILKQWGFVALLAGLWWTSGRSLGALGFGAVEGWRAGVAIGVAVAVPLLFGFQAYLATRPAARAGILAQLEHVRLLLPHTRREFHWFEAVSVTAGVCEEILFRGYLIWYLAHYVGVGWGAAISALAFGLAHAYQGGLGALRAGIVGAVFTGGYLLIGQLWPLIVAHAAVDATSGWIGYRVLSEEEAPKERAASA